MKTTPQYYFFFSNTLWGRFKLRLIKRWLNREAWQVVVRHRGPRHGRRYNTLKEFSTGFRVYFNPSKKVEAERRSRWSAHSLKQVLDQKVGG
jgi:hypothetical protein